MQPTLFLSHGSPLQALPDSHAGPVWRAFAAGLPRPNAALVVSAHWESASPLVSGNAGSETVHDFGGFPAPLYSLRYPAPPAADHAARVVDLLRTAGMTATADSRRGLDHGAWVPLRWMYPAADLPIVQLSVQTALGPAQHLQLGQALAGLPRENILVIGSGHATHNLREAFAARTNPAALRYVDEFADWLHAALVAGDHETLLDYRRRAPGAARAHPTEEHLLPLFVALGAAGHAARASRWFEGREGPALALDSWRFDPIGTDTI
ncbi:MAG: class III extradiol ring-cleavage dioxygenase [Steroidobacteraceae bacterium]